MGPLRLALTPLLFLLVRGEAECGTSGACSEGEQASALLQTLHVTQPHDLVELKENSLEEVDEVEGEGPPDLGEMPDEEDEMILDDPADDPALPMMGEEQDEDDSLLNIEEELGSHPALLEETVDGVKYTFELGGGSATVSGKESTECKGPSSLPQGGSGPVSISTMKYGSSCWTDGRYNSLDYKLELGKVTGSDGSAYTAARVSAPMKPASVGWVASQAMLYYKMPKSGDLKVSKLVGTSLVPQKTINGAPTGYVKTDIKVSKLSSAAVFVFDDGVEPSAGGGGGSSGAAASCSDSTTYKDPQWGDNCAAWANYDCSGHSYSDALKKACPKSCKVDCTPSTSGGGGGGSSTEFQPSGISKVLSGRSATACKKDVGAKSSSVIDSNFGLATGAYHGSCYPWGGYSNADFKVEKGTAGGTTVYNVYPPQTKATSFTAGGTWIFYKFSSKVAHTVYKLEDGNFNEYKTVSAGSITSGQFTDIKVRVDNLKEATMFAIVPSSQKPGTGGGGGGGGSSPSPPAPAPPAPAPAPAPTPPPTPQPAWNTLEPLQTFSFSKAQAETVKGSEATECKPETMDSAAIGDVAIVTQKTKKGSCWTGGRYNSEDFKVERGDLKGSKGTSYASYILHPAASKAKNFIASHAIVYYKMPRAGTLVVYRWNGKDFQTELTVSASKAGWLSTGLMVSKFKEPATYVFDTAGQRVSSWQSLGDKVEGAQLSKGGGFIINARKFQVGGHPFHAGDWSWGPGTHNGNYGFRKQYQAVTHPDGREGVVWVDVDTSEVKVTWFSKDLRSSKTSKIYDVKNWYLVAATGNGQYIVFYLLSRTKGPTTKSGMKAKAVKVSCSTGAVVKEKSHDTSKATGSNSWKDMHSGSSMTWEKGSDKIALVLSRVMTEAKDGLNHQGAIAVIIDANTLEARNLGQTSSHEFGNSLVQLSNGMFMTIEQGDAFPRGVQTCQFNTEAGSKLKCLNPFVTKGPVAQNHVYMEIAHNGLVEQDDGVLVFFVAESGTSKTKPPKVLNTARNVAFLKVSKDYYTSKETLKTRTWLTHEQNPQKSASRLKTMKMASGNTLLVWEEWGEKEYTGKSKMMVVGKSANKLRGPYTSDYPMNLPFHDDMIPGSHGAVAYMGASDGSIVRYNFCGEGC